MSIEDNTIAEYKKRIAELEAEVEELRTQKSYVTYGKKCLDHAIDCCIEGAFEADAELLCDMAVELGLLQYVSYDPDKHILSSNCDCEAGEMIYWRGE